MRESMDKNRIQGVSVGRAANLLRSPYPSSTRNVDPATVRGRRLNLPQEICLVSCKRLRSAERRPDRGAEVSRGHMYPATEKAQTKGVASRTRIS